MTSSLLGTGETLKAVEPLQNSAETAKSAKALNGIAYLISSAAHHEHGKGVRPVRTPCFTPLPPTPPGGMGFAADGPLISPEESLWGTAIHLGQ